VANLALSPTPLVADQNFLNITTGAVSLATYTGVTFSNSGREVLVFVNGSTASNATVVFGMTVLGQAIANLGPLAVPVSATSVLGPFHTVLDAPGTTTVTVTLSSVTGLSVVLAQFTGVT
jgi:hypothetical protein